MSHSGLKILRTRMPRRPPVPTVVLHQLIPTHLGVTYAPYSAFDFT